MTLPQNTETDSFSVTIGEDVLVILTVTENTDGTLQFDIEVDEDSPMTADIGAIFFDILDPTLADGLMVSGDDVSGTKFAPDGVDNLGKGANIRGNGDNSNYDAGVKFGSPGKANDDIQETSFILSHEDFDLTLEDLEGMDFAIRLTSVGDEDGSREASLKIDGQLPDIVEDPDPRDPEDPDDREFEDYMQSLMMQANFNEDGMAMSRMDALDPLDTDLYSF